MKNQPKQSHSEKELETLSVIARYRWGNGFKCRNCGGEKYADYATAFERRCTKNGCKQRQSATSGTIFNNIRMPAFVAMEVCKIILDTYERLPINELIAMTISKTNYTAIESRSAHTMAKKTYTSMELTMPVFNNDVTIFSFQNKTTKMFGIFGTVNGITWYQGGIVKGKDWCNQLIDSNTHARSRITTFDFNNYKKRKRSVISIRTDREQTFKDDFQEALNELLTMEKYFSGLSKASLHLGFNYYTFQRNGKTFNDFMMNAVANPIR